MQMHCWSISRSRYSACPWDDYTGQCWKWHTNVTIGNGLWESLGVHWTSLGREALHSHDSLYFCSFLVVSVLCTGCLNCLEVGLCSLCKKAWSICFMVVMASCLAELSCQWFVRSFYSANAWNVQQGYHNSVFRIICFNTWLFLISLSPLF